MTYEVFRGHEVYLATSTSFNFSARVCDRRDKIGENVARNARERRLPSRPRIFLPLALRLG